MILFYIRQFICSMLRHPFLALPGRLDWKNRTIDLHYRCDNCKMKIV